MWPWYCRPKVWKWFTLQEESLLHTSLQIERMNTLDYGSGMAYNYFYGYLRLVLPDPEVGTQTVKGMHVCFLMQMLVVGQVCTITQWNMF